MREHNYLVSKLSKLNTTWKNDDEKLYQTARKIVGAFMQHITYTEYLPTVLNDEMMAHYNLHPGSGNDTYNPKVHPGVWNEFSAAAFRFGHSLVTDIIGLFHEDGNMTEVSGRFVCLVF